MGLLNFINKKINYKIIFYFSVLFLISFIIISLLNYKLIENTILKTENEKLELIESNIEIMRKQEIQSATNVLYSIAHNETIQKLFYQKNRKALTKLLAPIYAELKSDYSQFQFHVPPAKSFLRLHKVKKYGDDLSSFRFTVLEANKSKKIIKGLEEGKGGYGFRVVMPISYNGQHVGTVEFGKAFNDKFLEKLNSIQHGDYYIYRNDYLKSVSWKGDKNLLAFVGNEDKIAVSKEKLDKVFSGEALTYQALNKKYNVMLMPFYNYKNEPAGYIKAVYDRSDIIASLQSIAIKTMIIQLLCMAVLISLIIFATTKEIINPIIKITDTINELSKGNLKVEQYKANSEHEITTLTESLNMMVTNFKNLIVKISNSAENVAAHSQQLNASALETSQGAEQVSLSITQLASGSLEQANSSNTCLDNINKFNDVIQKIFQDARNTAEISNQSEANAGIGKGQSEEAITKINHIKSIATEVSTSILELGGLSNEIEQIVDLIKNIATQTNLLALNAAIEAARAGTHGKGFAVVAEEVKKLAGESADSTDKINDMIKQIQEKTNSAVNAMNIVVEEVDGGVLIVENTGNSLKEILFAAKSTSEQVSNISSEVSNLMTSSNEIVKMMENIAAITEEASASSEEISSIIEEQTASLEEINASSSILSNIADELRIQASEFKV